MSKNWNRKDPHADREARNYDNPIPSRELIMQHLDERGAPAAHRTLCKELGLAEEGQQEALQFRLRAMCRDGQLVQNRKGSFGLMSKMDLIPGRVQGHKDGYGFLVPDAGGDDLFLSHGQMRRLFDGDRAVVRVAGVDRRGRREGQLVEVLERNTQALVGRYFEENGSAFVVPDNPRLGHDVQIADSSLKVRQGQFVMVDITAQPGKHTAPKGVVKEVLGDHMAPGMEIDVALRSHQLPHQWPDEVLDQIKSFSETVTESDKESRVDLRQLPLVTIDGEDARDFDDAVYCEAKRGGGWRLYVAIADVSHYVQVNTALDEEAQNRATSVYFPGQVIPMLPEILSNGLCSLNPLVDRLAMVCEMTISAKGKLSGYRFYEAVIQSHARLTYTQVGCVLESPASREGKQLSKELHHLMPHLRDLFALYKVLRQSREQRGAIDFETVETRILFGEERKIERIVPTQRNEAHKLIEECMLCANVATARFLEKLDVPALYRVHPGPKKEKLENLHKFLGELGLSLPGRDTPEPRDYQQLLEQVKDRPDAHMIQSMMLRSLGQATYTPSNDGHFGLAYSAYSHFTSPIRRYPDLLVHRAIRFMIRSSAQGATESGERRSNVFARLKDAIQPRGEMAVVGRVKGAELLKQSQIYPYDLPRMLSLGEHCSMAERRADEAVRDVEAWLKCEYMQSHIGETYPGVVTAVTGFGLFVELEDIFVEGLVHVTGLSNDYYHFDPAHQRLTGERSGVSYRLGDELMVKVVRVDLDEKKIDFELADGKPPKRGKKSRSASGKSARGKSDAKKTGGRTGNKTGKRSASSRSATRPAGELVSEGGKKKSSKPKSSKSKVRRSARKKTSR
ncbi:ribonuclease R [Aestuariirhabdus sp. Z084]|uniref:ribonuclease R n=1 Tax=Aestuariirhabdus haliotis TaxID=2918751 RepID=UPI00201B4088|nr:ribonuclease R [Aestuariirhabdus haliotis]MCL6415644.1 ribonuclease R [Aestuariirhabdus haliotis]MCL6419639.1 ribonuclease R [Aestuariirhabdus haliotis]